METIKNIGAVIVLLLIAVFAIGGCSYYAIVSPAIDYSAPVQIEGTVIDTYVKRYDEKDRFHVVIQYDDGEKEVLQNRDAVFVGKFNSANVQQEVEVGRYYTFEVRGKRIPILSKFRNIIEILPGSG